MNISNEEYRRGVGALAEESEMATAVDMVKAPLQVIISISMQAQTKLCAGRNTGGT
jgi:hypothetical protein